MSRDDRFDLIIHDMIEQHFVELLEDLTAYGWLWVKAQIWQESRFDPEAVSSAGAVGLMQLMPGTDMEIDGDIDGTDPVDNINNGVRYLAGQYRRFAEIPSPRERLRFALAAYNGGRAYVNQALRLARQAEGFPYDFAEWSKRGRTPGFWQQWETAKMFLFDADCLVKGKRPDALQMVEYVHKIESRFSQYLDASGVPRRHEAWG